MRSPWTANHQRVSRRVVLLLMIFALLSACVSPQTADPSAPARATLAGAPASPIPSATTPPPAPATPSLVVTASPAPTAQTGAISGRISYPNSDFIPPVTVYAIDPDDRRIWFSVEFPGHALYTGPTGPTAQPGTEPGTYTMTGVAPGRYFVVAFRNDGQKPDPGLYTREAECLRRTPSGPCPDQTTVFITVTAGQTTREIDIVSWWPGSGLMPPPPPRPTPR